MKSLRELYRIGRGPSSSHTIGPQRVAEYAIETYGARRFRVELFGSLAMTGTGHGTDRVLREVLGDGTDIRFNTTEKNLPHPNTMKLYALRDDGTAEYLFTATSVGGGSVCIDGQTLSEGGEVYPERDFAAVRAFVAREGMTLPDYVRLREPDVYPYLREVWHTMRACVERGLNRTGTLSGGLNLARKASLLRSENTKFEPSLMHENRKVSAYALAAAEENADNGVIVTAPTCGAAGIVPAVLYYMYENCGVGESELLDALAVAGVIGNVVKQNASISGAECGCQAEIGSACSMAAAALAELHGMELDQIEYAAEVAMEHHLGLTCDPVRGLVQIPCIERNAVAAMRAINALSLANFLTYTRKISFDVVVNTMYETGRDLFSKYRETGEGGLAKYYTGKK